MGVRNKCVCKRGKCKIYFLFLENKTIYLAMENLKRNVQTNNLQKKHLYIFPSVSLKTLLKTESRLDLEKI